MSDYRNQRLVFENRGKKPLLDIIGRTSEENFNESVRSNGKSCQYAQAKRVAADQQKGQISVLALSSMLSCGVWKSLLTLILLTLLFTACSDGASTATEETDEASGQVEIEITVVPTLDVRHVEELRVGIEAAITEAVKGADLMTRMRYRAMHQEDTPGAVFAGVLTAPERVEDRIFDENSFSLSLLPGGQTCLVLQVDSIWGSAGDIAFIDSGESDVLRVSLDEGLQAAGIGVSESAGTDYELVFKGNEMPERAESAGSHDGQETENLFWYAAIREKSDGKVIAVIDESRQWIADLEQAKPVEMLDIMPDIVAAYLDGEIDDIGSLTVAQREEFSIAYVEELNDRRGANPLIYDGDPAAGTAYLDPETLTMRKTIDGSTPQEQTIQMFYPVGQDSEGNLTIQNLDGQWITIPGSKGFDWNITVTDPYDPRIDWPQIEKAKDSDFTKLTWALSEENEDPRYGSVYKAFVFFPDKTRGQMYIEGIHGQPHWMKTVFRIVTINTDHVGNPVSARTSIFLVYIPRLFIEGESIDIQASPSVLEQGSLWKALKINQIYYSQINVEQDYIFNDWMHRSIDNWSGVVPPKDNYAVLQGDMVNNNDLLLINFKFLIEKALP